nr:M48 family metalloprotease [Saprospiraceae bacterium]
FLKYSRENESESDKLGVEYSSAVGYDAHHMANFFHTLNNMRVGTEAERLPEFQSTHPDPINRFNNVNQMASARQQQEPGRDWIVNRNSYLRRIDGMIYGEDPKQGYVDNNVFYHPELLFQFPIPNDWRLNNSPQQVQMAPKDGKSVMILTLGQGESLEAAAQKLITDHKLQVIEQKKQTLNGMSAIAMVSDQVNEQNQQTIRIMTYLISYNNLIYVFHGMSLKEDFDAYVGNFNGTMRNFKRLTDRSKIDVKPDRLKIQTVRRTSTLQQALTSYGMKSDQFRELALINGMALEDQVPSGTMIKTIVK